MFNSKELSFFQTSYFSNFIYQNSVIKYAPEIRNIGGKFYALTYLELQWLLSDIDIQV